MSKLSPEIEDLLKQVEQVNGTPRDAVSHIRSAIESSPYLQDRMEKEIAQGNLKAIAVRDEESQMGHFDDPNFTASLDLEIFKRHDKDPKTLEDVITYVLGHEVGHGNNLADRNRAQKALDKSLNEAYGMDHPEGFVDISAPLDRYVKFAGTDETRAEIEGWNSLVSRIETEEGKRVDHAQVLPRALPVSHFVVQSENLEPRLAEGVRLETGPYISYLAPPGTREVSTNAKAISAVYYTPELQARAATYGLELAAQKSEHYAHQTRQPPYETRVNLSDIGQTPQSMEKYGLDLGGAGRTFPITDTSHGMDWVTLKHTKSKGQYAPEMEPTAFTPDQPGFRYYEQAREAVRNSVNLPQGVFDSGQEERLAGSLAKAALSNAPPLRAIDHAVASEVDPETGKPNLVFAV